MRQRSFLPFFIYVFLMVMFLILVRFISVILALAFRVIPYIFRFWYIFLFAALLIYFIVKWRRRLKKVKKIPEDRSTIEIHEYKIH
ncbi:MAG: hypothetical protein JW827_07925 [Spirochaetes bacterium]|nr:hypothetical protein [Spirochaetota bacterium]